MSNSFLRDLKFVGVSSFLGTGMKSFLEKLDEATEEFETQYKKWIDDRREAIKKQRENETLQKWNEISNIFKSDGVELNRDTQTPCIPEHLVEGFEESNESEDLSEIDQIEQVMLNPKGRLNFV